MENKLPKRKPTRLQEFDYNSDGAYFLTVCTKHHRQILSHVVGGDVLDAPLDENATVHLSPYGEIAEKYIRQLDEFYTDIRVEAYVIMPNHIHILLLLLSDGASRRKPPTKQHASIPSFVSTFKRFCNKEFGTNIWQRHFNDHIIRNREDYEKHLKYIYENPMRWYYDELYADE